MGLSTGLLAAVTVFAGACANRQGFLVPVLEIKTIRPTAFPPSGGTGNGSDSGGGNVVVIPGQASSPGVPSDAPASPGAGPTAAPGATPEPGPTPEPSPTSLAVDVILEDGMPYVPAGQDA
jgi:hypothetical protein